MKHTYTVTQNQPKKKTDDETVNAVWIGETQPTTLISMPAGTGTGTRTITFDLCVVMPDYNNQQLVVDFRAGSDSQNSEGVIDEAGTCVESQAPSPAPSLSPSNNPTGRPTVKPTNNPTGRPTVRPTVKPTNNPTPNPTGSPTGSANSKDQGTSNWGVIGGSAAAGLTVLAGVAMGIRRHMGRGAPVDFETGANGQNQMKISKNV